MLKFSIRLLVCLFCAVQLAGGQEANHSRTDHDDVLLARH